MNESQKLLQSLKNAPEHTLSVRELCKISGKTPEEVRRLLAGAPQGEPVFRADGTVALTRDVLTEGNLLAQTPLSGLTVTQSGLLSMLQLNPEGTRNVYVREMEALSPRIRLRLMEKS